VSDVGEGRRGLSARGHRAAAVLLAMVVAVLLCSPGSAHAAYGEYKVLLAEVYEDGAHKLGAQFSAFPEVKAVDYVNTDLVTPTAAELAPYDVVVSIGDSEYLDNEAWGESLAAYVDGGGVVVQTAYDNWEEPIAEPGGRFASGGYAPFIPGNNGNNQVSLGAFDTGSPLMQGVAALTSELNTEPEPAPGATVVAKWSDGTNAIAVKGHVVSISAFIGDGYGEVWSGDYGRVILNSVRTLGRQPPPPVVTPVTPVTVPVPPSPPLNVIKLGKLTLNKKAGTAKLTVRVPGAGGLVMTGKGLKRATVTSTAAAVVTVPVKLAGKAKRKLLKTGNAKVRAKLAFTPTGGTAATQERKLTLKKKLQ
jgi:hypothetical protein